eukprot:CAMPEP_0168610634 /NCGR_PEP_ID=MMETSP0449_2-20121227/1895_1 /TAXON_ID=1082188 /ORGANISM="Strombidium rassoulzadegani, Strain ras09" /LENGTH=86 /DNA_ID=CAMNT_0008650959 /DNA_START=40 /DNA_END=300 /DNA_ORIENTATION=+
MNDALHVRGEKLFNLEESDDDLLLPLVPEEMIKMKHGVKKVKVVNMRSQFEAMNFEEKIQTVPVVEPITCARLKAESNEYFIYQSL